MTTTFLLKESALIWKANSETSMFDGWMAFIELNEEVQEEQEHSHPYLDQAMTLFKFAITLRISS